MAVAWLGPIGGAVSKGSDGVARAVEIVVNGVGEVVADPIESIGNGVQDVLTLARGVPVLGWTLAWVGAILSGACDLVAVAAKGACDATSGLVAGPLRVVGGILSGDAALLKRGGLDAAYGVGGGLLLVVAELVCFAQAVYPFTQPPDRGLTPEEKARVLRAIGDSIALYNVRLFEGSAGVFGASPRPFTLGNKIYLKDRDVSVEHALLVHECVHAWQYQHLGPRYAVQALAAQFTMQNAYDWQAEVEAGCSDWRGLNREAQAELIADAFAAGRLVDAGGRTVASGDGAFFDADGTTTHGRFASRGVDHSELARGAAAATRALPSLRPSRFWS